MAPPQSSESAARRPLSLTSAPPPPLALSLLPPSCDDVGPTRSSRIPPAIVRPFPWSHLRGHCCPDRSHITDSRASGVDSPGQHCPASTAGRTHVPAGLSDASSTRGLLSPPSLPSGAGSPVLGGGQRGPPRGRRGLRGSSLSGCSPLDPHSQPAGLTAEVTCTQTAALSARSSQGPGRRAWWVWSSGQDAIGHSGAILA